MDIGAVNPFETTTVSRPTRMSRMSNDFGTRLREFRDARGWTQERVGFELGVTKATVSKWETGRAEPGLHNLERIRRLYAPDGLTLDYLIDDVVAGRTRPTSGRKVKDEATSPRMARNQDEVALLTRFRALTPAQRKALLDLLAE